VANSRSTLFGAITTVLGDGSSADPIARLTEQLEQLYQVNATLIEATTANTTSANSRSSQARSAGSSGSGVVDTIGKLFGQGFGLSPIISGIASLFGGGESSTPAPLVRFALPPSVHEEAGVRESAPGSAFAVDHASGGAVRAVAQPANITVQVQAMDSQSFLDRSRDIALAVRQAMLESSVLNDVIREA